VHLRSRASARQSKPGPRFADEAGADASATAGSAHTPWV
jgi:hypothetical protein